MSSQPNSEELNKDKEAKKQAVTEYIASKCVANSDIEDLRNIGACLSKGSKLDIEILTGGLCNYSFKISCKDTTTDAEYKLFAKLAFAYAVFMGPDNPLSLERTENEYKMMATFQKVSPGSVPTPYFCDDIGMDMKLLVCQWARVDEQFGNQFIDGAVDPRTAAKLAEALGKLHRVDDFDPNFNSGMSADLDGFRQMIVGMVDELCKPEKQDRFGKLAKELGKSAIVGMFDVHFDYQGSKDCLVHGDCHPFNLLVGAKPSIENLENFDSSGDVVLIDWEMSRAGCAGQDIGPMRPFPIACALAHTLNGNHHAAEECLDWIDKIWSCYEAGARSNGVSDEQLTKICRYSLQVSSAYLLYYSCWGVHMDFLPIDEGNTEDLEKVKECLGVLFLKCMKWGTDESLSLQELKDHYKGAVREEKDRLAKARKVRRNRRSSVLRASGRRVSDAYLHLANLERSISLISADGSI